MNRKFYWIVMKMLLNILKVILIIQILRKFFQYQRNCYQFFLKRSQRVVFYQRSRFWQILRFYRRILLLKQVVVFRMRVFLIKVRFNMIFLLWMKLRKRQFEMKLRIIFRLKSKLMLRISKKLMLRIWKIQRQKLKKVGFYKLYQVIFVYICLILIFLLDISICKMYGIYS